VACAHLCLLSLARLADWFRWSLTVAYVAILLVASLIVLLIFIEPASNSDGMMRLLAVAAIIDAAITILVPIFHWLSREHVAVKQGPTLEAIDREIATVQARLEELHRLRADALPK
jgi:hypothetical protein